MTIRYNVILTKDKRTMLEAYTSRGKICVSKRPVESPPIGRGFVWHPIGVLVACLHRRHAMSCPCSPVTFSLFRALSSLGTRCTCESFQHQDQRYQHSTPRPKK